MAGDHDYGERRRGGRYYEGDAGYGGGNSWHQPYYQRNGKGGGPSDKLSHPPLPQAVRGVEEATSPNEWALHCAAVTLEHQNAEKSQVETTLSQIVLWLNPPASSQVLTAVVGAGLGGAIVRTIRKFRNEPPTVALACIAGHRVAGSSEGANAQLRAGAVEEVVALMDRHPNHGGVQNVSLLLLSALLKDTSSARQSVSLGLVQRVLRAMEATMGREVQFNGLGVIKALADQGRAPRAGLQDAALRAKVTHQADAVLTVLANDVLALVTPRFKEMLCWHWQSGWCKLGPRCTYAHGPADLRGGTGGVGPAHPQMGPQHPQHMQGQI